MQPHERIIFALDVASRQEALELTSQLAGRVGWFKVGLQLFCSTGPELVRQITAEGGRVFLDLKLHDIPATISRALDSISGLGVGLTTVHIQAGEAWRRAMTPRPGLTILGVSVLTSLSAPDLADLGHQVTDPSALVRQRAGLARQAGLVGVVCSGKEAAEVRAVVGPDMLIVCPGIRPASSKVAGDDQARITTPAQALAAGADLIVVGRPIRAATDPAKAADQVAQELAGPILDQIA